ncbi:uncharacterized protein LOC131654047 [Vicia villosa]|uniref:uncharacterized protein LOC131654047 n=1 Tax=Vicia villosa TaxID=3911 RepID=UPI00273C0954|nr:uncharacterized protein LOC131654047 [Vicia villosa]
MELREIVLQFPKVWENMVNAGRFKMTTMYAAITKGDDRVRWRHLFRNNEARPKALHTTWMTCHGNLPTKERLKRFHIINEDICIICNLEIEIAEHLFFNCRIASDIWKGVLQWMDVIHQPKGWDEELYWVLKSSRKKGWRARVLKLAFAEIIYGVW